MGIALVAASVLAAVLPAGASYSRYAARTWGTNGRVLTILPAGDRVYVGGTFGRVNDTSGVTYPAKNLAVFSATTGAADLGFAPETNSTVRAIARSNNTLFVAGDFTAVTGSNGTFSRNKLAAFDLITGSVTGWAPSAGSGQVEMMVYAPASDSVYVGGNFTVFTGTGGISAPNPFIAKVSALTGVVDTGFGTAPDDRVRALDPANDGTNRLFVGGDFGFVNGLPKTRGLVAVDLNTGAVDTAFQSGPNNEGSIAPVYDIAAAPPRVFVAAAGQGGACAGHDSTTGATIWSHHSNGNMQGVVAHGDTTYCGGHFGGDNGFANQKRNKLAAVDSATGALDSFKPRVNSPLGVWTIAGQVGDPNLYVGGDFTAISGKKAPHYAQFVDSTVQTAPQPPGNLLAQADDGVVHLSWKVPSSDGGVTLKEYRIFRSESPGGQNLSGPPLATIPPTVTVHDDLAVTNGTTYYYVVVATNSKGDSLPSNEAVATPRSDTQTEPPGMPTSVAATAPPGYVNLTWNPPADNGGAPVTSYNVYRSTASGSQGLSPYVSDITATFYEDRSNVTAGTTYYYRITAVNAAGEGPRSAEVFATVQPGKPRPPTLSGHLNEKGEAVLSWTVPPDGGSPIKEYIILRDRQRIGRVKVPGTTYTDKNLDSGVTYAYQVRAKNDVGTGPPSKRVFLTGP